MNVPSALVVVLMFGAFAGLWLYRQWDDSDRAAGRRWKAINRAKRAAGCPCGRPATEVRYDHSNTGPVPVETWTCDEHVGASGWSISPRGATPLWPRSSRCDTCTGMCSRVYNIGEDEPYQWNCPMKPGREPLTDLVPPEAMDPALRNIGEE